MGTIRTGYWSMAFILTPIEFKGFIEYSLSLNIHPDRANIDEQYELFYNELVAKTKPLIFKKRDDITFITLRSYVSGLVPKNAVGFMINPFNMIHWPHYKEAVRISNWAVQITLPKGISEDKQDEKDKHFIYKDIQFHSPQSYPLYKQLTAYIKNITKPLRLNAQSINGYKEIKTPVRISKQAAADLADSWIFNEYEFKIQI
ncbi:hypothetical protein [uncultured Flavobacterium sp.]|uniref:hypothetical protein n=1 Tax=uncultured Flavobacterium sp. TaxID=165435 RepID=UPI002597CE95|nr:hypothetical protein [uncultured Flavobacterium sp.]